MKSNLSFPSLDEKVRPYLSKLEKIKLFATDCDGIMTTGHIFYQGEEIGWGRTFHVLDGHGLKLLKKAGFQTAIITGGNSKGLHLRANMLHCDYVFAGNEDKGTPYGELLSQSQFDPSEILYIGDDVFDLPVLNKVGFSATVPDAPVYVRDNCDYVTEKKAGLGAVREVCDMLLYAQDKLSSFLVETI